MIKSLFIHPIFIACFIFGSCSKLRYSYTTPIKTNVGKQSIYLEKEKVELIYYGDYLFHPFKSSQNPNNHREFTQLLLLQFKPTIVFSAHTIIQPYCNTIGTWYNKVNRDTLANSILNKLKMSGNAENVQMELRLVGKVYNSIITYDLYNSRYKYFIHYADYLSEQGDNTFRITFSTADSNLEWFQKEREGIISSMAFR